MLEPQLLRLVFICLSAIAAGLVGLANARADQPNAAVPEQIAARGIPRTDRNSLLAHAQLVEKARQGGIDLYFAGDSITRRWGTSDTKYKDFLANWKENFYGWNAGNFGWGGDTVQNILWRLEQGELEGVHPKVIVLMAGTNNLGNIASPDRTHAKVEEVTRGVQAILESMRRQAPEATIILMGITPRNDGRMGTALMPTVDRINVGISQLADGKKTRYLNINDKLADREGKLFDGVTVDGLHLSVKGYQIWADALHPLLTELLGPPARTDHAPEPTGDPSAQVR
jgi:lysophospholipase L1-like esterase